jgi:choline dehydrogenase-like flavoprotein
LSPELADAIASTSLERVEDARGFDAIVVGAGAAGGLAARLLTEQGLSVLALDAGWREPALRAPLRAIVGQTVPLIANPRLEDHLPPAVVELGRRALRLAGRVRQPIQATCFAWALAPDCFVDDRDHPYTQGEGTRFHWYRALQFGGRMVIPGHGRQYYRLSAQDLGPRNGTNWGLAPGELDPWYAKVERMLRMRGGQEHCDWVPDSELSDPVLPNAAEAELCSRIRERWPLAQPILGRSAAPLDGLDAAARTARLSCRRGAIAREVLVDRGGHTHGVTWFDRQAGRLCRARAPIVFLCASSLESTRILLQSRSAERPEGIGGASGILGRFLMDHILVSAKGSGGELPGGHVDNEPGHCVFLPRFDLREGHGRGERGFGLQVYRWSAGRGRSHFLVSSFGEMIPRPENRVTLDPHRRDACGAPVLRIECRYDAADLALARRQSSAAVEVAELMNVRLHHLDTEPAIPGMAMHECGTARMGASPSDSVLDPNNECWDARGVYVTDAAAFAAQGSQNPTLTILALTARACHHAAGAHRCATAGAASMPPPQDSAQPPGNSPHEALGRSRPQQLPAGYLTRLFVANSASAHGGHYTVGPKLSIKAGSGSRQR